MLANH